MKAQSSEYLFHGPFLLAEPLPLVHQSGLPSFCTGCLKKIGPIRPFIKRVLFAMFLSLVIPSGFAQGWINFNNSPSTLYSVRNPSGGIVNASGTYYFSLLTAPVGSSNPAEFAFSGVYATNLSVAGRFFGGNFLSVPTWAIGTTKAYLVAGWSGSLGTDWHPAWLNGVFSSSGYFGLSSIGTGVAGGIFDTNKPPLPPLILFGSTTGIQSGISLYPVGVPEPPATAIVALGTGLVFAWRRAWFRRRQPGGCLQPKGPC